MTEKAQRAQAAAENGRQKELYSIVKQLTGHNNRQVAALKSKDGELLKNMPGKKMEGAFPGSVKQRHTRRTTKERRRRRARCLN